MLVSFFFLGGIHRLGDSYRCSLFIPLMNPSVTHRTGWLTVGRNGQVGRQYHEHVPTHIRVAQQTSGHGKSIIDVASIRNLPALRIDNKAIFADSFLQSCPTAAWRGIHNWQICPRLQTKVVQSCTSISKLLSLWNGQILQTDTAQNYPLLSRFFFHTKNVLLQTKPMRFLSKWKCTLKIVDIDRQTKNSSTIRYPLTLYDTFRQSGDGLLVHRSKTILFLFCLSCGYDWWTSWSH